MTISNAEKFYINKTELKLIEMCLSLLLWCQMFNTRINIFIKYHISLHLSTVKVFCWLVVCHPRLQTCNSQCHQSCPLVWHTSWLLAHTDKQQGLRNTYEQRDSLLQVKPLNCKTKGKILQSLETICNLFTAALLLLSAVTLTKSGELTWFVKEWLNITSHCKERQRAEVPLSRV